MREIGTLQAWIAQSKKIVFFGGAGVSTESGIPDFRSADGLYNQKYDYPVETMLSADFFRRKPEEFYRFYRDKMLIKGAKPNAAHQKLAEWEREGRLLAIITQNIDGLHQMAGSKCVYELHGTMDKNRCINCGSPYPTEAIMASSGVPRCACGGIIKPEVVLYGEQLNAAVISGARNAIRNADLLIVGGTSLVVYPAAGLIDDYRGDRLVLINKSATGCDGRADLILREPIGALFSIL